MKKMKNWRGIMSLVLAIILCCSLPVNMLAETDTETVIDPETGNTITTTTETTPDAEAGSTTVTITVHESNADGTYTKDVETTTVTDSEGNELSKIEDGTEVFPDVVTEDNGNEPGQPEVKVDLEFGASTEGSASHTTTSGDVPKSDDDMNYNYTETTFTERTVEATTSTITTTENSDGAIDIEGVIPENYEGKVNITPDSYGPASSVLKYCDVVTYTDEDGQSVTTWVPRFVRTEEEMNETLKPYYTYNESTGLWTPKTVSGKKNYTNAGDWDFVFAEGGEYSESGQAVANNNYNGGKKQFVLYDQDGDRFYAYCMDSATGTDNGYLYTLENLDDADYFKGTAEEQAAAKEHVRAIVLNGYWGVEEGTGSFANLKQGLIDALNNGLEITIEFTDGNGAFYCDSSTPEGLAMLLDMAENINEGEALAATQGAIWNYGRDKGNFQGYNPFRANAPDSSKDENGKWVYEHGGPEARMILIASYLQSLTAPKSETTIIDQDGFLTDDGLSITVGDKIADAEENRDDNKDNDVYNVDLSFTMVIEPTANDDLVVSLYDADGNLIRRARLAGSSENDGVEFTTVKKNGSTYTFENLPLSENSDITFDLRLDGYQNLEKGVYIYKHINGYDKGQTLVGLAEGTKDVDVTSSFTINFNVDENDKLSTVHKWHSDSTQPADPTSPTNPTDPTNPFTDPTNPSDPAAPSEPGENGIALLSLDEEEEIREEEVPLNAEPEEDFEEDEEIEILDEEVPLAEVPETGDLSPVMMMMILLSVFGLIVLNLPGKKVRA